MIFLLFWTLICMIWMKLTLDWCCFQQNYHDVVLCRNKSFRNEMKLCEVFLHNKREFLEPRTIEGGHLGGHNPPGRAPLQARPGGLSPPGGPANAETYTIKSHISRKNRGERIIAFHETEPPSRPILHQEARSGVRWGFWEGDLWSSSSPTLLHRQFHDAPHREWDSSCNRVSFVRAWSLVSTMFSDWCCYDFAMLNACHFGPRCHDFIFIQK